MDTSAGSWGRIEGSVAQAPRHSRLNKAPKVEDFKVEVIGENNIRLAAKFNALKIAAAS